MSFTELTEAFFTKAAGWEAVKNARSLLAGGKVISSNWSPPLLKGVVAEGGSSYRAGLVIKGPVDIDNLCPCRASREGGVICSHSVAVGLHHVLSNQPAPRGSDTATPLPARLGATRPIISAAREPEPPAGPKLKRAANGQPLEISVIFPPNFAAGLERGKVMATFEGKWAKGRVPLGALPMNQPFALAPEDARLLDKAEELAGNETPGGLMLNLAELTQLLEALGGHPRVSLGRAQALTVSATSWRVPVEATLETSGEIRLNLAPGLRAPTLIAGETLWAFRGDSLEPVGLPKQWRSLFQAPMKLPRARVPLFLSQELVVLEAESEVDANFTIDEFTLEPQSPQIGRAHV